MAPASAAVGALDRLAAADAADGGEDCAGEDCEIAAADAADDCDWLVASNQWYYYYYYYYYIIYCIPCDGG